MDFLTQQFIAFVRRFRIEIGRLQDALQKQTETIEQAAQTRNQQQQLPPQILAELHIPEAIENARTEQHNQTYRLQVAAVIVSGITAIATIAAFAAAAIYAYYAKGQLEQMRVATQATKDAADLTRRQVIGSMSAVVVLNGVEIDIHNYGRATLAFANRGHVVSTNANVSFEILHTSLDGVKQLSKAQSYAFTIQQLDPIPYVWSRKYKLSSLAPRDFRSQNDTFTFKGTISFDNGFGERFTQPFCVSWLGYWRAPPVEEHEGFEGGGPVFMPCDEFMDKVAWLKVNQDPNF